MNEEPNRLLDGESMRQFHARILSRYSEEKIAPAVECVRKAIDLMDAQRIREAMTKDPEDWCVAYHMFFGMAIRNALRRAGFGEDYWPIWNLDDIYVPLIERAVQV